LVGIDELGEMIDLPRARKKGWRGGTSKLIALFTNVMSRLFRQPHQAVMTNLEWLNLESHLILLHLSSNCVLKRDIASDL
jgi:hypothetical protein